VKNAIIAILAVISILLCVWCVILQGKIKTQARTRSRPHIALSSETSAQARETAKNFLEAMANADWDTVARFWPPDAPKGKHFDDIFTDKNKNIVTGLEIISIGEPYKEGQNSWILVPYKIRWKNGGELENDLRLGQKAGGQWVFKGGF
jgi:hypothetical protein